MPIWKQVQPCKFYEVNIKTKKQQKILIQMKDVGRYAFHFVQI